KRKIDDLKALDDKTISEQLEQFIVEVRKLNGQEYKASLLYTGFCTIARGISEAFENIRAINLFDKHKFKNLHRILDGHMKSIVEKGDKNHKQSDPLETDEIKLLLDSPATSINDPKGGDAKHLKASWLKELENGRMQLELPKKKNYAGGIKDPYAEACSSFIPPDISGNMYTPVADIKKYLTKHPNDTEDDFFFVTLNTPKKIYCDEWYLPTKLGKGSHDTMIYSICKDAKLDFKGHMITNHSIRSTGIHSLVESGRKLDNISHLIPIEEAEFSKASDLISIKQSKTSNTLEDETDNQKSVVPKISIENCSNISINIIFNNI
ncbi:872_t:CDS:2, partial [Racocetra persica]